MPIRILIIEDEKLTARDLAATIKAVDDQVEILPFLHSVEEGIYFLKQQPEIDLIFSDIDLGDGLSFQIFRQQPVDVPIIFCTAFEQYMLDAFKTNGIDYILKPFKRVDVEAALGKYQSLKARFSGISFRQTLEKIEDRSGLPEWSLIVQKGEKIIPVAFAEIAYFTIENEATFVYTFNKEKNYIPETLDALEERCGNGFYRANRQFLVNRKAIISASRHFNRKLLIQLTLPYKEPVLVGKLKVTDFLKWLEQTPR